MIPPRVEVLSALPLAFVLRRVDCILPKPYCDHLQIERTNDAQGFPVRWRLRAAGVVLLEARSPIVFDGEDPFDHLPAPPCAEVPSSACVLNLPPYLWERRA